MSITYEAIETRENPETGEIITRENRITKSSKEDIFFMTFIESIGFMKNLSKTEIQTVFGLMKYVTFNDNEVVVNRLVKDRISELMNISLKSINNSITGLVRKQIIKRVGRGTYQLNPHIFGKGNIHAIRKLKMTYEWDFEKLKLTKNVDSEYFSDEELEARQIAKNDYIEAEVSEPDTTLKQILKDSLNDDFEAVIDLKNIDLPDEEIGRQITEILQIDLNGKTLIFESELKDKIWSVALRPSVAKEVL